MFHLLSSIQPHTKFDWGVRLTQDAGVAGEGRCIAGLLCNWMEVLMEAGIEGRMPYICNWRKFIVESDTPIYHRRRCVGL